MSKEPTAEIRDKDAEVRAIAAQCDPSEWLRTEPAYLVGLIDRLEAAEAKLKAVSELLPE